MRMQAAGLFLLLAASLAAQDPPDSHRTFARDLNVACGHCHTSDWSDGSKVAYDRTRRMSAMVAALNADGLREFGGVTCWTCHRGSSKPARLPRASWEAIAAQWPADLPQERKLAMSVYAASLGVECSYCHTPGDWPAGSKKPKQTAGKMIAFMGGMPKHFEAGKAPSFQCFQCHQGTTSPPRAP